MADALHDLDEDLARKNARKSTFVAQQIDVADMSDESSEHDDKEDDLGSPRGKKKKKKVRQKRERTGPPLKQRLYNCLARPARFIARICVRLFDFTTCHVRQRRALRAENKWIDLGDREARLTVIRAKRREIIDLRKENWKKKGQRRIRIFIQSYVTWLLKIITDIIALVIEYSGRIDSRTGLPTSLLEQWRFTKLVHSGQHGYTFEAVGAARVKKAYLDKVVVIKLRDKSLGHVMRMPTKRALKILKGEVIERKRKNRLSRFLTRIGFLHGEFRHSAIAEVYAAFENAEFFVEITEKASGGTVGKFLLESGTILDEYAICSIFKRVVKALHYLHARRIVHRDVRLAQVLMTKSADRCMRKGGFNEVKLGDLWCLARFPKKGIPLRDEMRPSDIATKSPEVLVGDAWTDKADMWSVGCMLFELLHGHLPFGGEGKALVQRICTQKPEFDYVCGKPSDEAIDLVKKLLKRNPHARFSAGQALRHPWIMAYSGEKPLKAAQMTERRIRHAKLFGKPVPCRRGMPAENLLAAKTGMFNAGFCSYMGTPHAVLDFIIGTHERQFWVTHITVAMWSTGDNPKEIVVQSALRPDMPYTDQGKKIIESKAESQAKVIVEKPILYCRIRFQKNFGGSFGIALRKLTFYGYDIRAVPVRFDYGSMLCAGGAEVYMHTDSIVDVTKVHKSIRPELEKGAAIVGTGSRYRTYRDIFSGMPHTTTTVSLFMPEIEPGLIINGACMCLQFFSEVIMNQTPPRLKVMLETDEGDRIKLFSTSDLPPSDHDVESILTFGYDSYETLYSDTLNISTDLKMTIELHIENNAGSLHIPADFGLTFYYLPNLPDESSSSSSEEEEHVAIEDKKDKEDAGLKAAVQPVQQLQNADVDGMEGIDMDDVGSSDWGSIMAERELRTDLAELTKTALYGAMGTSAFERREMESWFPHHAPLEGERGSDTGKPESDWWQHSGYGTSSEDLMSGPMQNAGTSQTTADTMQQKKWEGR